MGSRGDVPWEEADRREIGVTTTFAPRSGATFALLYSVTERRVVNGKPEWRERCVAGSAIYQASNGLTAKSALLEIVAIGVEALSVIARENDIHLAEMKGKRRGRS